MAPPTSSLRTIYISIIVLVAFYALCTEPEARIVATSTLSIFFKAVGYTTRFVSVLVFWLGWAICHLLKLVACAMAQVLWSVVTSIAYRTVSTAYTLLTTRTIIDSIDIEWLSLAVPAIAIPLCWIWLDYKFRVPVDIRERFNTMAEQARKVEFPFWSENILSQSEQETWDRGSCSALPAHVYPWSMGEVERVMLAKEEQLELIPVLQERITAYNQRKQERESEIARAEMAKTPSGRLTLALSASNRNRHLRKSASTSSSSSPSTSNSNEPSPSASSSPPCTTPETSPEISQSQKPFSKSFAPYNLADLKFIEAQRQSLALSQASKTLPSQRTSAKAFALPAQAPATQVTKLVTIAPSPSPARASRSFTRLSVVARKAAASSNALNVAEESNASATPTRTSAAVDIPLPTPVGIAPSVQPISILPQHPAVQNVAIVQPQSFEASPPLQLPSAPSALHPTAVASFTVANLFYPVINTAFVSAAIIHDHDVSCVRKPTTRHPKKPFVQSYAAAKLVHVRPSVVRGIRNPCLRPTTEKHWASYAVEEDETSVLKRSMVARRNKTLIRHSLLRGVSRVMYVGDWDESIHKHRKLSPMSKPRPHNGFAFAFTFTSSMSAGFIQPQVTAVAVPITVDYDMQATSLEQFLAAYTPPPTSELQEVPAVVSSPARPQAILVPTPNAFTPSSLPFSLSITTASMDVETHNVQAPPATRTLGSPAATATAPKPFFLALPRKPSPLRNSTVAGEIMMGVEFDPVMAPPATLPPPKATFIPSGSSFAAILPPPSYTGFSKGKGVDPAERGGAFQMPGVASSASAMLGVITNPATWQCQKPGSSYQGSFPQSAPPPTQAELDSENQEQEDAPMLDDSPLDNGPIDDPAYLEQLDNAFTPKKQKQKQRARPVAKQIIRTSGHGSRRR